MFGTQRIIDLTEYIRCRVVDLVLVLIEGAFSKMYSIVRPIQAAILKLSEPYNLVSVFFVAILFRLFKLYLYSKFILVTKWFVFWPLTGASVLMIWILVLVKAFKLRFFIHIQIQ